MRVIEHRRCSDNYLSCGCLLQFLVFGLFLYFPALFPFMLVAFLSFSILEFVAGDMISPFASSFEIKYPCIEGYNVACFEVQHFCMLAEGDKFLLDTSYCMS